MSREIKFRGKSPLTGKWAYGSYVKTNFCNSGAVITGSNGFGHVEVNPETVGQYTGVKDKSGVDVYEDDALKCKNNHIWIVRFDGRGSFVACDPEREGDFIFLDDGIFSVIGNTHDNDSELLK